MSKPLLIHVIDSLGIGGAERLLSNTLQALTEYRHIVCYLMPPHDLSKTLAAEKVFFLNFKGNKDILSCAIRLRRIIKAEKPQFVHAHLLKSTWVSRLAIWKKVPLVFTIHNYLSEDAFKINKLSLFMERLTYRKGQTLVAVSEAALHDYKNWVGIKGPAFILYNIIDDSFFKVRQDCKEGHNGLMKLVAVGNLRRQKNYLNLVQAFAYLQNEEISLDIYGQGDLYEPLKDLIAKKHLRVNLKGQAKDIASVLLDYDAFILASFFEGYGIAPVEAMAAGLPVILSDLEVFHEITGSQALFFNPADPLSIADAIKKFIGLPQIEKEELRERGKRKAMQIASEESFRKQLLHIYNHLN